MEEATKGRVLESNVEAVAKAPFELAHAAVFGPDCVGAELMDHSSPSPSCFRYFARSHDSVPIRGVRFAILVLASTAGVRFVIFSFAGRSRLFLTNRR